MGWTARARDALLVLTFVVGACGGDSDDSSCGDEVSPITTPATITIGSAVFSYSGFTWGANNDCTPTGSSVISVTLRGGQTGPSSPVAGFGLCLPQPDQIGKSAINLQDATLVQLAGATANDDCLTMANSGVKPTGTVKFTGFCTRPGRSFIVEFNAQVPGTRNCFIGPVTDVNMVLGGRTMVVAQ
jgi:hypothetical protein